MLSKEGKDGIGDARQWKAIDGAAREWPAISVLITQSSFAVHSSFHDLSIPSITSSCSNILKFPSSVVVCQQIKDHNLPRSRTSSNQHHRAGPSCNHTARVIITASIPTNNVMIFPWIYFNLGKTIILLVNLKRRNLPRHSGMAEL